jgi:hypothetical protein
MKNLRHERTQRLKRGAVSNVRRRFDIEPTGLNASGTVKGWRSEPGFRKYGFLRLSDV